MGKSFKDEVIVGDHRPKVKHGEEQLRFANPCVACVWLSYQLC